MPFAETHVVDERTRFIEDAHRSLRSVVRRLPQGVVRGPRACRTRSNSYLGGALAQVRDLLQGLWLRAVAANELWRRR